MTKYLREAAKEGRKKKGGVKERRKVGRNGGREGENERQRKERIVLAHGLTMQSIMAGKAWWQGNGWQGSEGLDTTHGIRKQREKNDGALLGSLFFSI